MKAFSFQDSFFKICLLLGCLMLCSMLSAEDNARMHLERACKLMATQTMQVTERVTRGQTVTEFLTWQRRNPDGTVERMTERLKDGERLEPAALKIGQHVFRVYYTKGGKTVVRVGKNTARGIRSQHGLPVPKLRRECEITEGRRVYDGQFCWDIMVRTPAEKGFLVEEYLVSGTSQMILLCRKFDVDGRLLREVRYRDYDLSPNFPEGIFELPTGVVVHELRGGEAEGDLREELEAEEKEEMAELYEQKNLQDLKADLRYWLQGTVACLVTMLAWLGAPLAVLVVVLVLHRRRWMAHGRN